MICSKAKIGYYKGGTIFSDAEFTLPVSDAISDYTNVDSVTFGKGLIIKDELGNPFFFQTDLNTSFKIIIKDLISAFTLVSLPNPTDPWAVELNTNLQTLITKLNEINKIIP
jgi:hypothetical protein